MTDEKSSVLGKHEYWQESYKRELINFEDHRDYGVTWFGYSCQKKIVDYVKNLPLLERDHPILELGSGNGLLLIKLAKEGFQNLTGVDYVEEAITLSKSVAESENVPHIKFLIGDVLDSNSCDALCSEYNLVLDKGTFDAITLNPELNGKVLYPNIVSRLLSPTGVFLLCSCNFTFHELKEIFEKDFCIFDEIKFPQISFGGKSGSTITTIVLKTRKGVP